MTDIFANELSHDDLALLRPVLLDIFGGDFPESPASITPQQLADIRARADWLWQEDDTDPTATALVRFADVIESAQGQ